MSKKNDQEKQLNNKKSAEEKDNSQNQHDTESNSRLHSNHEHTTPDKESFSNKVKTFASKIQKQTIIASIIFFIVGGVSVSAFSHKKFDTKQIASSKHGNGFKRDKKLDFHDKNFDNDESEKDHPNDKNMENSKHSKDSNNNTSDEKQNTNEEKQNTTQSDDDKDVTTGASESSKG